MAKTTKKDKKAAPAKKAATAKKVVAKKSKDIKKKTPSTAATSRASSLPTKVVMKDLSPPVLAKRASSVQKLPTPPKLAK